jgi:hypothetical protein
MAVMVSDMCMVADDEGEPCSFKEDHPGLHSWDDGAQTHPSQVVEDGKAFSMDPPAAQVRAATTTTRQRDVAERILPPTEEAFEGADFLPDPKLDRLGRHLLQTCPEFQYVADARFVFLWKRKGGASKGQSTLGKLKKPSGDLAYFAGCDFILTLSADHVAELGFDNRQIEALMHHELSHADAQVDEDTGEVTFTTRGHDVEEFAVTVRKYGLWRHAAEERAFANVIRQLTLDEAQ